MKKNYVKKLCAASVLSALFVAFEIFSAEIGKIAFLNEYQIPISCFPLILASVMLGPTWGIATGIVGSFLSQIVLAATDPRIGVGWSSLLWMIPTICYSASVALLFLLFKKNQKPYILGIEFLFSSLLLSSLNILAKYIDINVLGVYYGPNAFGTNEFLNSIFAIFVSLKIIGAVVFAIIFAIIVPPIIKKLKSIIKF